MEYAGVDSKADSVTVVLAGLGCVDSLVLCGGTDFVLIDCGLGVQAP